MAEEDSPAVEEGNSEDSSGGGSKKFIYIIAGAILVLGGAGLGAYFFVSGDSDKSKDGKAVSAETTETSEESSTEKKEEGEKEDSSKEGDDSEKKDAEDESAKGKEGEAKAKEEKKDTGPKIDFGETYKLETFNLNLGNALENRFVRMNVALEYGGGENHKKEIDKRLPQLRDAVIQVVSRKTREFLLAPDGKDALRKEIQIRINRYMTQKITAVYITDILIE